MKILAIEKEAAGKTRHDFKPFLKDEALKVWQLYKIGIIREIYFNKEENTAVIIMECENKNDAQNILNDLPLVKNNLINFEIIPLSAYNGFERLFNV
jgi:hypothetical protein